MQRPKPTRWQKHSRRNPFVSDTVVFTEKWTAYRKYDAHSTELYRITEGKCVSIYKDKAHPSGAVQVFADGHADGIQRENWAKIYAYGCIDQNFAVYNYSNGSLSGYVTQQ